MINVAVEKTSSENGISLIKRFTKRVQGAGILPRVRKLRAHTRKQSQLAKKKRALKSIKNREELQKLIKLGKAPLNPRRR